MPDQTFMHADGEPIEWLRHDEGSGQPIIPPDIFSACRFLMAVVDHDFETVGEILRDRPAIPLLGGVAALANGFGVQRHGGGYRQILDLLALNPDLDAAGAADEYRVRRTSAPTEPPVRVKRAPGKAAR